MTFTIVRETRAATTAPTATDPTSASRRVARPRGPDWPATGQERDQVWELLTCAPFAVPDNPGSGQRGSHEIGLGLLLDWLEDQPGESWQQRWVASGVDTAGRSWRQIPASWLDDHGHQVRWRHDAWFRALLLAIAADLIRPAVGWLVAVGFRRGSLVNVLARHRDAEGFARIRTLCGQDLDISTAAATRTSYRAALIVAAKGGTIGDITTGDVLELLEAEAHEHGTAVGATHLFYRILYSMGGFEPDAPASLRELRTTGQRTCGELIDRYGLICRPVRDLLIDYLKERQPALDYTSLETLANFLGNLFWADLERHHPGIDSLHLAPEIADAWKQRLRTVTTTTRGPDGRRVETTAARINYRECLTPVRAFYLDLAHWAVEDPARWAPWVVPCPVSGEEISRRKDKRHRKARMDARTRERLPVLPLLVRTVDQRRKEAAALLETARQTSPGESFTAAGQTMTRATTSRSAATKIWAEDPATGKRRDLGREEEHAFWAFAAVEVLRATGIRIEELTELSHHSLVQYRLPTTGEIVPLLQIAPSKTDAERLLVVSPELAEVLSTIISRVRDTTGAIPLVSAYDGRERDWLPPAPLLFQRRARYEDRAISPTTIRTMLANTLAHTGLTDPATDAPLQFTPHDFRRLHHRRCPQRAAPAHRPGHRRTPRHQRHPGLQGHLP